MADSPPLITLICDRCRAEGAPGDPPFAEYEDLLDFAPVPRKKARVDGWDAAAQRAFIAALATTGSPRRAAAAVGKAQWGAEQLRKADGSDAFNAAWDRALQIAKDKGTHRLAAGIAAAREEDDAWAPAAGPWSQAGTRAPAGARGRSGAGAGAARRHDAPPEFTPEEEARAGRDFLENVLRIYLIKLASEREARLAGRIVEADFYLRQLSWFEVALDLASGDALHYLTQFRFEGQHLTAIVETPMSRLLDRARRDHWAREGDPPRPPEPFRPGLVDHGRWSHDESDALVGGPDHEENWRRIRERQAEQAKAQIEWEAEARRDYEARRAASQPIDEEPGQAGRRAPDAEQEATRPTSAGAPARTGAGAQRGAAPQESANAGRPALPEGPAATGPTSRDSLA